MDTGKGKGSAYGGIGNRTRGWFVADVPLVGGWIIDLITGNIPVYDKTVILPVRNNDSQTGPVVIFPMVYNAS